MGKFVKGQSGNPGGRKVMPPALKEKCENATAEVVDAWIDEVRTRGENWMKASELIVAYAHGKPAMQVEHAGVNGEAFVINVKFVGD